jgi:outer membrane protein assembly factor BamB
MRDVGKETTMRQPLHIRLGRRGVGALLGILALALPAAAGAAIDASNVASLELKWSFPLPKGVTSQPILGNGLLYVTAWNGIVYALDPESGGVVWSFDTGSGVASGLQGSVLVTPGGDVCVGDSLAHVWCRDGLTGAPIWTRNLSLPLGPDHPDHVWSALATANGRLFIGIASHSDVPCTRGRLVALDLATGGDLWTLQTVPDNVCTTDTATVCTVDSDCPAGGTCVIGRGAGVTATVSFDPTGSYVYMNTVGCYTFPSIGDSDSAFKVDAATGGVVWKTRVDPPEQFGACNNDPAIDCGTDADCGASNTCVTKAFYHDFGFLNGPTPVDVPGKTLLISGSKNGTLYAFNEATGAIEWAHAVAPEPVTPAFAGFGLFNGPVAIADGRVHAALYDFSPSLSLAPKHLQAFDVVTGASLWQSEIGISWSGVSAVNGVVYAGSNAFSRLSAYNAATGAALATFTLPTFSVSRATIGGNSLYVGYGIFGGGGVRALRLPTEKCTRAVNKETGKFVQQRAKILSKCELAKLKGNLPSGTVCVRDDQNTVDKLAKIESKKIAAINKQCGGKDKACGGELSGEIGAVDIGFGSACPGLEGLGLCTGGTNDGDVCTADTDCTGGGTCAACDAAIDPGTCTDAIPCVDCIATVAAQQMNGLLTDGLVPTDPASQQDENKCQQEIQKSAWKFYAAKSKVLQKCWDKRLLGKHTGICPDAAAAVGSEPRKAADKIGKAESKMIAKICKKCGGDDKACGGSPDLPLAGLYSPAPTCPAVTLPGPPFTACGGITVTTVQDLVACLDCVAEFKVDCLAANQVPSVATYPAECL